MQDSEVYKTLFYLFTFALVERHSTRFQKDITPHLFVCFFGLQGGPKPKENQKENYTGTSLAVVILTESFAKRLTIGGERSTI